MTRRTIREKKKWNYLAQISVLMWWFQIACDVSKIIINFDERNKITNRLIVEKILLFFPVWREKKTDCSMKSEKLKLKQKLAQKTWCLLIDLIPLKSGFKVCRNNISIHKYEKLRLNSSMSITHFPESREGVLSNLSDRRSFDLEKTANWMGRRATE